MGKIERARNFLSDARKELKKVVWPNKQQTLASTRVVLIFVAIISLFLGLVDSILGRLVKFILS